MQWLSAASTFILGSMPIAGVVLSVITLAVSTKVSHPELLQSCRASQQYSANQCTIKGRNIWVLKNLCPCPKNNAHRLMKGI